jgi:hypothetical protein
MEKRDIRINILDSCTEDAYGSWELWWGIKHKESESIDSLKGDFVSCVKELVDEKKIIALHHRSWDGKENIYTPADFDQARLEYEIDHSLQETGLDPDTFYWFEATDEGRKEYKEWARSQ